MRDLIQPDLDFWFDAVERRLKGEKDVVDFKAYFDKSPYRSTMDYPFCSYYAEIQAALPDTKFILTVREPESWFVRIIA